MILKLALSLALAGQCAFGAWSHYRTVTIASGKVTGTLSDFTAYIKIVNNDLKQSGGGGYVTDAQGDDIVPYSDNTCSTMLSWKKIYYDSSTGTWIAAVKHSSAAVGTVAYVCFGNTSITTDQSSGTVVDSSTAAFYNFGDGTTLSGADYSSNGNTLTITTATAATGKIAGGADMSASGAKLNKTSATGLQSSATGAFTLSGWFNATSTAGGLYGGYGSNFDSGFDSQKMRIHYSGSHYGFIGWGGYDYTYSATMSTGSWQYWAMTYEGTGKVVKLYINGSFSQSSWTLDFPSAAGTEIRIGANSFTSSIPAVVDEFRIDSVDRSADWIAAVYQNQNDPEAFYTLGSRTDLSAYSTVVLGVDNIIRNAAMVTFQLQNSGTPTNANHGRVRWGTSTGTYTKQTYAGPYDGSNQASWIKTVSVPLNQLPSNTTIYYVACLTLSSTEYCSAEDTFTSATYSAPSGSLAEVPAMPARVSTTRPTITGTTRTVGADCDDPTTGLLALWSAASYGDEIVIPASTVCAGRYTFASKSYPGAGNWIVIRSGGTLPPQGVRVTPSWDAQMPVIRHSSPAIAYSTTLDQAQCDLGRLAFSGTSPTGLSDLHQCMVGSPITISNITNSSNNIRITATSHGLSEGDRILITGVTGTTQANGDWSAHVVDSNTLEIYIIGSAVNIQHDAAYVSGGQIRKHTWGAVPVHGSSPGAALPGTCTKFEWFQKTGSGDWRTRTYWCVATNTWEQVYLDNTLYSVANGASFDFYTNGVQGVWLRGLKFTTNTIPDDDYWTKGLDTSNTTFVGNYGFFANVSTGGTLVVYEQCQFKPHKLARVTYPLTLGGANSFVVDSYFADITSWRAPVFGAGNDPQCSAININYVAPGPMLIRNNYIHSHCVASIFSQDQWVSQIPESYLPHDLTIEQNDFVWEKRYQVGTSEHNSSSPKQMAMGRHHVEMKYCKRCAILDNTFTNSWACTNQGAAVALSSRIGGPDLTITCSSGTCQVGGGTSSWNVRRTGEKMVIGDNYVTVTGTPTTTNFTVTPSITASSVAFWTLDPTGLYDITMRRNKFSSVTMPFYAIAPQGGWFSPMPFGPFLYEDNLTTMQQGFCGLSMRGPGGSYTGISCSPSCTGEYPCFGAALDTSGQGRDWTIKQNTWAGTPGLAAFNIQNFDTDSTTGVGWASLMQFDSNIAPSGAYSGNQVVWSDYVSGGETLLDKKWANYSVTKNVWYGGAALPTGSPWGPQPSGNTLHRTDISGDFPFNSDYSVANTYVRGGGYALSGLAAGADILFLPTSTISATVVSTSSGTVRIRYTAPDGGACTVEYGASATYGVGSRVSDGGGGRARWTEVSSLTPGSTYEFKVFCPRATATGSFTAN